jgi:chromosome partitioning protein
VLSTYGIPQIETRVAEFAHVVGRSIEPFGIALTKFRVQSSIHLNTASLLRGGNGTSVFNTEIPEGNQLAATAEFRDPTTLREKIGYRAFPFYLDLTKEIMEAAE